MKQPSVSPNNANQEAPPPLSFLHKNRPEMVQRLMHLVGLQRAKLLPGQKPN